MENKSSGYKIHEKGMLGEVKIADEVIAIIAGLAATEVKGVAGMCGNITNELVSKLGMKNLSKGVRVIVEGSHVRPGHRTGLWSQHCTDFKESTGKG